MRRREIAPHSTHMQCGCCYYHHCVMAKASFLPKTSHTGSPAICLCRNIIYIRPEGAAGTNRSDMLCFWDKDPALWLPEVRCPWGGPWQLMFSFNYWLMSVLLERGEVELEWSSVSTDFGIVELALFQSPKVLCLRLWTIKVSVIKVIYPLWGLHFLTHKMGSAISSSWCWKTEGDITCVNKLCKVQHA